MKTISDFNFKNKTVLLRADLNSDVVRGKLIESGRIKASAETIKELKKKKAKVVVIAHQGQPGGSDFISLKQHSKLLNKYVKVKFVEDIVGKKAEKEIKNLKSGQAILLENIRFEKDEYKKADKNNKLIKNMVPLADIYLNDAFSVSHRDHVSLSGFAKYLPSCAGRLMEKELKALKKINPKNCLCIFGGAKPEDNMKLLKGQKVLACGLFGQLCVIAKGKNLGAQNKYLKKELHLVKKLKKKLRNVITPVDFAVKVESKRKELDLSEFPSKYEIFDIGKKTQEKFIKEIKKAKSIFMKGPAGFCADKKFCRGTKTILKAIAKSKSYSLLGGGHLNDAIKQTKTNKKRFNHISLSGGALLRYVAGEKLPGLKVLNKKEV